MHASLAPSCVTALLLIVTAGPNVLYVLTRGATQGRRAGVTAGLGLTNPKTMLFFLSLLPQFVSAPADRASRQLLVLGVHAVLPDRR